MVRVCDDLCMSVYIRVKFRMKSEKSNNEEREKRGEERVMQPDLMLWS